MAERLFRASAGAAHQASDPMGRPIAEVRVVRDDIKRRVDTLLDESAIATA